MHHPTAQAHAVLMVAADPSRFADEAAESRCELGCERVRGWRGRRDRNALGCSAELGLGWGSYVGSFNLRKFFGKMLQLYAFGKSATGNIMLALILLACLVVVRAQEDPCIALQERMIDTYNSPECAYARTVISTSDVMAGITPPDPVVCSDGDGDGLSCVANVTQTMDGFAEHGCVVPEPAEELSAFMYPISDNDVEFVRSTQFYCTADDCYATVRDTLQDPMHCNISEPLGQNEYVYAECFRWVPCGCVRHFGNAFRDSSTEFTDEFGPPSIIVDAAAKAFELGYCVDSSTGPTTSGGTTSTTVGVSYSSILFIVASCLKVATDIYW